MANQKENTKDITKKSGLSTTTVSRVLNGKAKVFRIFRVSQEILLKITKELNYVPTQYATYHLIRKGLMFEQHGHDMIGGSIFILTMTMVF